MLLVACTAVLSGTNPLRAVEASFDQPASTSTNAPQPEAFNQPKTLTELLAIKPEQLEQVDVALINLLCAQGLRGSENLDVQSCLDRLKAYSIYVGREIKRNEHHFTEHPEEFNHSLAYYRMGMMGTVLAEDVHIRYDPKLEQQQLADPIASRSVEGWNVFFADSKEVFLHGLLGDKPTGTCASMPFFYVAIGRRLGYPVTLAATMNHFYVRYEEGNGKHLNIEATENRGFATPTDDEYRHGEVPITEEAIQGSGWLQPLSNKAILGMCLLTRSSVLRSMKQYDQEIAALDQASRYLPDTPLMKRVLEKNRQLARNLRAADRWDELSNQLGKMSLPTGGPKSEYFQNRRFQIQSSMNQSTNLAQIERDVTGLNDELARYVADISDSPVKLTAAFGQPQPAAVPPQFLALLQEAQGASQTRRVVLPLEQVPGEYYWNGMPPELLIRLRKLASEEDIVAEMHAFWSEENDLRNFDVTHNLHPIGYDINLPPLWQPKKDFKLTDLGIPENRIPWTYRKKEIPPELQQRLVSQAFRLDHPLDPELVVRILQEFFINQDQRRFRVEAIAAKRRELDRQPAAQPPVQIEFMPPRTPNLPLTADPQKRINDSTDGKGKP